MRLRQLLAVLEVVAVFVLGHALSIPVERALGVPSLDATFGAELPRPNPDWLRMAGAMAATLLVQYACLFALAGLFCWRRRRGPRLAVAGRNWRGDLALALAAFALCAFPLRALLATAMFVPLGPPPPIWIIFARPWPASFWLFAAVGSFVLVPILEELFYRGYCQGRLAEEMSSGTAVVVASALFVLTHGQYRGTSVLALGTVIGIAVLSLGIGVVYATTRSLLAAMLMHALIDVPLAPPWAVASLAVMALGLALLRRPLRRLLEVTTEVARGLGPWPALIAGTVVAAAAAIGFRAWPRASVVGALIAGGLVWLAAPRRAIAVVPPT